MEIKLIGHSCVLFKDTVRGQAILCDPWLQGRVFNNGWTQSPMSVLDEADLQSVTHLYISHEHPDHLHFPTLKSFSEAFKRKVTVIFQKLHDDKVPRALASIGYHNVRVLQHLERLNINDGLSIHIYQHRHLDSALLVRADGKFLLNLNDVELTYQEGVRLREKFGPCDVLLSQFSIAGSEGIEDKLRSDSDVVIAKLISQAQGLRAKIVIPFASFVYFCMPDNFFINQYANSVLEVKSRLKQADIRCHLLFPGSEISDSEPVSKQDDEIKFIEFYKNRSLQLFQLEPSVSLDTIKLTIEARMLKWRSSYPSLMIKRLGRIVIHVSDLNRNVKLDFVACRVTETADNALMTVNSQPLFFAFSEPFGIQTLGVSGRYRLESITPQWKAVRIVSSLHNAGIALTVRGLSSPDFLSWVWSRRSNVWGNVIQQFQRFAPAAKKDVL